MFRHLGVLLEPGEYGSDAAIPVLEFALGNSARISLWYAQNHPDEPHGRARCEFVAREVLARTEAAALAMGIPCKAAGLSCAQRAHEIVDAAHLNGCDAIATAPTAAAMGVPGSPTSDLLALANVPVLMFGIGCAPPRIAALELLRTEYRRHAGLLHEWFCLLSELAARGQPIRPADRLGLRRAVEQIRSIVHPLQRCKELTLYGRLRRRVERVRAEIDELVLLGQRAHELLGQIESMVTRPEAHDVEAHVLLSALDRYAHIVWTTRGREEGVIVAAARRHLSETDWERLHGEFVNACRDELSDTGTQAF